MSYVQSRAARRAACFSAISLSLAFAVFVGGSRLVADDHPPDGSPERDQRLQALALEQAQAGSRYQSLSTLAEIRDDRVRSEALDALPPRARGGGVQPDFDSLIELITTTIAPTTWTDVGGQGALKQFPAGVWVDAAGVLHRGMKTAANSRALALLSETSAPVKQDFAAGDVRRASLLRKVSLPRLEREVQLRLAAGLALDEEMQLLAGLTRIEYVLLYEATGDVVLAGPAGDWKSGVEGRTVSVADGSPVLRLEDLVVLLERTWNAEDRVFGCSITPTREALARTQSFAEQSAKRPLKPGQRGAWLEQLRSQLGQQIIDVYGVDPHSRVAQVLVEADYRMKLVGIGLEPGVLGVTSYLDLLEAAGSAAPVNVLRWWFTMNYKAIAATPGRDAFQIRGPGVKVLSENELLTAEGERVHTGASDALTAEFAHSFTQHFVELAARYPVYAELRNVFDMALVAELIKTARLAERANWHLTCFGRPGKFPCHTEPAPTKVDTVLNHRVVNRTQILAAVSGGVVADPREIVDPAAIETDRYGKVDSQHAHGKPADLRKRAWWWD